MKKIAVFVEGYTELIFIEKLFCEIAGESNVLIEPRKIRGGSTTPRTMRMIRAVKPATDEKYHLLIVDCGGDDLVKSRIQEEQIPLTQAGYSLVIGVRDVRPTFARADIPKLEIGLTKYIKTSLIPVVFILAVMEVEAWFLAEATHFIRLSASFASVDIPTALGFDPGADDLSLRDHPAKDLGEIYRLGGLVYAKRDAALTVDALDFARVYLETSLRFSHLQRLVQSIENFLAGRDRVYQPRITSTRAS